MPCCIVSLYKQSSKITFTIPVVVVVEDSISERDVVDAEGVVVFVFVKLNVVIVNESTK